eukprot:CAMPEP_0198295890 /NCGR_PEP_ID=MMETSP1449-20131203/30174_1 /TAXON_ID=420275 /ORGANISM="Attheya septentrionalis, Strain CCMP2084" /LENGTH=703 /DNA_ID=CAMNT_0043996325 /DNA_START=160 /DNA_END=2271 /DNA_ORIENTATION=-
MSNHGDARFDVVIVGAGPSAIGLLYGLLTQNNPLNQVIRIAVLERGGNCSCVSLCHSHSCNTNTNASCERGDLVQDWFAKAHQIRSRDDDDDDCGCLEQSIPQEGLNGRVVDVPSGQGLGGGTNINACLVIPPKQSDFSSWPGRWTDGTRLIHAATHIRTVMEKHDGLSTFGNTTPPNDQIMTPGTSPQMNVNLTTTGPQIHTQNKPPPFQKATISHVSAFDTATIRRFKDNNNKKASQQQQYRVSYYDSLIKPLLLLNNDAPEDRRNEFRIKNVVVTFLTGVEVKRLIFQKQDEMAQSLSRVVGVECVHRHEDSSSSSPTSHCTSTKQIFCVYAERQVILCAGAIQTPVLLMKSGIGPPDMDCGIVMTNPLSAVGAHLRDHVLLPRTFLVWPTTTPRIWSWNSVQSWYEINLTETCHNHKNEQQVHHQIDLVLTDGALANDMAPHFLASLFRRRFFSFPTKHSTYNDHGSICVGQMFNYLFRAIRLFLWVLVNYTPAYFVVKNLSRTINVCLMNPQSKGSVRLTKRTRRKCNTGDDELYVCIDPGYMTHPKDMDMMRVAWNMTEMIRHAHFPYSMETLPGIFFGTHVSWILEQLFGKKVSHTTNDGDDWPLRRFVGEFATPYYHWCGTCRMGDADADTDNDGDDYVVTEDLKVKGVDGLFICDASVFPDCISAPTALTCAAMGYASSSFLLTDRPSSHQNTT